MRGLIALAFFASSAALAQSSNFLPGVDFAKYHTYQWVTTRPHPDSDVDAKIKQSVDSQLAAKGLSRMETKADLTIDYRVAIDQHEAWSDFRINEIDTLNRKPITVNAGTLAVDITDPTLKQIVWSGRVSKAIDLKSSGQTKLKNLDKSVQSLMRFFPPKQR